MTILAGPVRTLTAQPSNSKTATSAPLTRGAQTATMPQTRAAGVRKIRRTAKPTTKPDPA